MTPPAPATALIVAESRGLVRAGLAGLLAAWPHGPVGAAATLHDALRLCAGAASPILLLDQDLLGEPGPAALARLRAQRPTIRVIALTTHECRDGTLACLAAGAHGTIARTAEFEELARAIETVRTGGIHVPAALAAAPPPPTPAPTPVLPAATLTGRQQDVLRLLAEGRSTKDIARTLDLAVSTIKVHLAAVYRTVGARNRVEALCRTGLLLAHAA